MMFLRASKLKVTVMRQKIVIFGVLGGLLLTLSIKNLTAATTSLPELLKNAEKNAVFVRDFEAMQKLARSKLQLARMSRWLSTFELKALGGAVPDAVLTNPNDVNSYSSNDLENDFSFSNLGGFFRLELEAIQPVFTFGKLSNYESMAERGGVLAELEKQRKISDIRELVKRAYYTFLLSDESIAILREVEAKLNQAAEKVEELLIKNAETVTETDRLKIRVFLADVRNRSLDADRAHRLSKSALEELTGMRGDWILDETNLQAEVVTDLKKSEVISAALRAKPEIGQLDQLIAMKQAEKRIVQADLFPTFFVAGKLQYGVAPGRTDVSNPYLVDSFNFFDAGVALGLKQDLGVFRTLSKMDGVQAEIDRLNAQREQFIGKTKLDAEKSYEEAYSAQMGIKINEDGFRAARSWLTSAGLAFNLGTAETKEVLESFAAYFKARVDLIRSIYTLNLAYTDLSDVVGIEVVDRLK